MRTTEYSKPRQFPQSTRIYGGFCESIYSARPVSPYPDPLPWGEEVSSASLKPPRARIKQTCRHGGLGSLSPRERDGVSGNTMFECGRLFLVPPLLSIIFLAMFSADAADNLNSSSSRPPFSAFKMVTVTNIFNSKRSASYVPSSSPAIRPRQFESFALVGVMAYDKGPF